MTTNIDAITRVLEFDQAIERVWQAITDPKEVSLWFGSAAVFELAEGAVGYFEWEQECEGRFAMRIDTIQAPSYFAWRWMQQQDQAFDEATSTLVEWHLKTTSKGTQLTMIESGFAELKQQQLNNQGWDQELNDLIKYLAI